ncbi:hypothetical protein CDD81_1503 [Ophiocordyceps australis]|uniref:Uncharacterized protein n=1 Tax=Ophiocordyceps australis TaxID=1399860 RepID=A0A2C5YDJ6_9HYPO|nr:hypothetical protein CDD81_1503 [Ophiocordyceps australis]
MCSCSVDRHSCPFCLVAVEEVIHFCPLGRENGLLCAKCKVDYRLDQLCDNCEAKAAAEVAAGANSSSLKKRIRRAAHSAKDKMRHGSKAAAADLSMTIGGSGETTTNTTPTTPRADAQNALLGLHYDYTVAGPAPVMGTTVADTSLLEVPGTTAVKRHSWFARKLTRRSDRYSFSGLTPIDIAAANARRHAIDEPRSSHDTATTAQTQVFTPARAASDSHSDITDASRPLPKFSLPRRDSYSSSINDPTEDSASVYSQDDDDSASVYSQ